MTPEAPKVPRNGVHQHPVHGVVEHTRKENKQKTYPVGLCAAGLMPRNLLKTRANFCGACGYWVWVQAGGP